MLRKVCPMNPNRSKSDFSPCMQRECAWWNELSEQCSIVTIAQGLLFEICESEVKDDAVASIENEQTA